MAANCQSYLKNPSLAPRQHLYMCSRVNTFTQSAFLYIKHNHYLLCVCMRRLLTHQSSQNTHSACPSGPFVMLKYYLFLACVFAVRRCMQSSTLWLPPQTSPPPHTGISPVEDSCLFLPQPRRYRKSDHWPFCCGYNSVPCSHPFSSNILLKQIVQGELKNYTEWPNKRCWSKSLWPR